MMEKLYLLKKKTLKLYLLKKSKTFIMFSSDYEFWQYGMHIQIFFFFLIPDTK